MSNTELENLRLKSLVLLSDSVDEADGFISKTYTTPESKKDFVDKNFGYRVLARRDEKAGIEREYRAMLSLIVNQ